MLLPVRVAPEQVAKVQEWTSCAAFRLRLVDGDLTFELEVRDPTSEPLLSPGQSAAIHAKRGRLAEKLGMTRPEARTYVLNLASRLSGREIGSTNELTQSEANRLLDELEDALDT